MAFTEKEGVIYTEARFCVMGAKVDYVLDTAGSLIINSMCPPFEDALVFHVSETYPEKLMSEWQHYQHDLHSSFQEL